MKSDRDEAVAEVRAARTALCERFDNDPHRLLQYLRQQQHKYRGRVIKSWSELKPAPALAEAPAPKRRKP